MAYTLIKGTFRIVGFEPDGDSIRFAPADPTLVDHLPGMTKTTPPGGSIQLRLECIDSLETHYLAGSSQMQHQPLVLADAGRNGLLALLGFTGVTTNGNKVTGCNADDQPGYILANKGDSHGTRPVSYAFTGAAAEADGASVFLNVARLKQSANYKMVELGLAYPMYYEGAFYDLRAAFDAAVATARATPTVGSVWPSDVTSSGFTVPAFSTLVNTSAVWPKLFRRVSNYFHDNPQAADLSGLVTWLASEPDPCFDLVNQTWTKLHEFVDVTAGSAKLTRDVTQLVFKD
jgi:hypothetical protein